ncbi:hypothetical protein X743_21255 [Mesorhizobium sp. LNHC252B00]|nr:hypothetical protein X743_21255 [Mesorhizobium sp. LNHC252B00]
MLYLLLVTLNRQRRFTSEFMESDAIAPMASG